MESMAGVWFQFAVCMAVVGYGGARLARYGDIIGDRTGWSGNLAGLLLLSTVTSLPELATGVSAAGFANQPDIAAGDIFGSCAFNLLILAVLDAFQRERPLYRSLGGEHQLSAALGLGLLAVAGAAVVLGDRLDELALWHVGIAAPVTVVLYALAMRLIQSHDGRHGHGDRQDSTGGRIGTRRAVLGYLVAAAVVVAAGAWLPFVGTRLSEWMGWENSFVGTLFVAAATSMPELAVSLTALRLGRADMAVASVLGSNVFNMAVLAIDDLVYLPGPMLSDVAPIHAVTVFATMAMGATVIAALVSKPSRRLLGTVSWPSALLIVLFVLASFAQYRYGAA